MKFWDSFLNKTGKVISIKTIIAKHQKPLEMVLRAYSKGRNIYSRQSTKTQSKLNKCQSMAFDLNSFPLSL